jgi:hypothetical protein
MAASPVAVPAPVAAGLAAVAPMLAASLAAVVANLKTGLPPAVLEAAADESSPLVTATLLAQLEAATGTHSLPAGIGVPVRTLETVDAYRWGLLVGLNYRPALGRPIRARLSVSRPRCETCSRLLEQTRSGALVCPAC